MLLALSCPAYADPDARQSGPEVTSIAPGIAPASTPVREKQQVPEPSSLMMLGFGIAGVLIGRFAARRRGKSEHKDGTP